MIKIDPVVKRDYSDLLGEKTLNGHVFSVEGHIEEIVKELGAEVDKAIRAEKEWHERKESARVKGAFPKWDDKFVDAHGDVRVFREIMRGLKITP